MPGAPPKAAPECDMDLRLPTVCLGSRCMGLLWGANPFMAGGCPKAEPQPSLPCGEESRFVGVSAKLPAPAVVTVRQGASRRRGLDEPARTRMPENALAASRALATAALPTPADRGVTI